jgi:hypothetical protein
MKIVFMNPIKIMIDSEFREEYGPEICWAWRSLLNNIGYPWEEVTPDCQICDIVYSQNPPKNTAYKLHITVDRQKWDRKKQLRIVDLEKTDHHFIPKFSNVSNNIPIWSFEKKILRCSNDIVFDFFWIVSGQEEKHFTKDKHGIYDLSGENIWRRHIMLRALASEIGTMLEIKLKYLGFKNPIPRWPSGKKAAFCATHDVDCPEAGIFLGMMVLFKRHGVKALKLIPELMTGRRSFWQFESFLNAESKFDLRSSFYFCAKKGSFIKYACGVPDPFYDIQSKKFIKLFKVLIESGAEIGLHASYLAGFQKEMISHQKQLLEECCGVEIEGNRHHYWHLNPSEPDETLHLHEQVGFKYDLSLANDRYVGWRRGYLTPFFPFHKRLRREIKTLQISSGWMDNQLFGGLEENEGDRQMMIQKLLNTTLTHGGCLTVDVHDYVFDEKLFPGWAETYLDLVRQVFDSSDFWIATAGQVSNHWRTRYAHIVKSSLGLTNGFSQNG